jgi:hypothetical protein
MWYNGYMAKDNVFTPISPTMLEEHDVVVDDKYPIIWQAFSKATWLHRYFEFTPDFQGIHTDPK